MTDDNKNQEQEEEVGGLDDDGDETLTLVSMESEKPGRFELEKKSAMMCKLVRSILEGDPTATEIPIKKVKKDILERIVEYLKHHNGKEPAEIAKPIRSVKMDRIVEDKWDAEFINKMSKKVIFQVILGANYMDVPSLLHLGCAKIATLIKGKSPDEIKQILSEDDDDQKDDKN